MAKYVFKRYYKTRDGEIDDENVWVRANSKLEARAKVERKYSKSEDFYLLRVE